DYMYSLVRDGGYGNAAGTSIASPYVLGAIALVASANPGLSAQQIVDIIEQTADDVGEPGWDEYHGWGKINLHRAVLAAGEGPADDIVGPTVSVSSPAWGEVVCDTVLVSASAIDNVGVIEVQLYLDDRLLGWDTVAPYSWSWDTEGDRDGEHTLIAVACDAAGNSGESSPITVVVDNGPPAAEVVSPAFGSVVAETVRVEALASDLVGVGRVDFYLDGQKKKEAFVPPYVWDWDTKGDANGRHAIVARAVDGAGNACDSQPVEVTVENNAEPIEQTEVFSGRAGGRNGWVSIWVRTNVGGPLRATLKSSGRFALSLYVCNEAGELLARDVSSANFKFADLWVAPGNYEFLIGSIRQKSNFVLEVTHF
ncbi:MAG: S8 family serine peptidase, partial [Armatimonadota bacterium]